MPMDLIIGIILQLANIVMFYHWLLVVIVATATAVLCFRAYEISLSAAKGCFERSLIYLLVMCTIHFIVPKAPGSLGLALLVPYLHIFLTRTIDCLVTAHLSWDNPKAFKKLFDSPEKKSSDYFEPL